MTNNLMPADHPHRITIHPKVLALCASAAEFHLRNVYSCCLQNYLWHKLIAISQKASGMGLVRSLQIPARALLWGKQNAQGLNGKCCTGPLGRNFLSRRVKNQLRRIESRCCPDILQGTVKA